MSSLASRLLGRDVLTLEEFAREVVTRLSWWFPDATITQPRPDLVAVCNEQGQRVELALQAAYRDYLKDTRTREHAIQRFVHLVESGMPRRP